MVALAVLACVWGCAVSTASAFAFEHERIEVEARRYERDFLAAHPSLGYRVSEELHLRLDGGRERVLKNLGSGGAVCDYSESTCYSLIAYSPMYRHFLVFQGFYESWEYLLIDRRTGRATYVHDDPHLSPDNRRIATAIGNLSDEFVNGISVWLVGPDGLQEDWVYAAPDSLGYEFDSWTNDRSFLLKVTLPSAGRPIPGMGCWDTRSAIAAAGPQGWQIRHGRLLSVTCYPLRP